MDKRRGTAYVVTLMMMFVSTLFFFVSGFFANDRVFANDPIVSDNGLTWEEENALAFENIEEVAGWTQEIFEGIQIATRHTHRQNNETTVTYSDGSSFEELLELVGRNPENTSTWEAWSGDHYETTATWRNDGWQPSISVTVTFIEETGMIIDARVDGWGF